MAKGKGKQTTQEIYRAKKRRDEEEKDANLPPGLLNQGNTCFMNSTLQGLIATRPLHDLMYFEPVPPSIQPTHGPSIVARRSPQLTNGHGYGGADELEWTDGMPLGDIFTTIMRKAWDIQDAKRRESVNPKEILTTIGRKYDQYLDFRQQDAHEFLRHMLDAMRMEELDIIKKRQPPLPKKRQRVHRHTEPALASPPLPSPPGRSTPSNTPASPQVDALPSPRAQDDERLESFVDMLFGGQLASILVCENCKKISVTHEDFNDVSLSIKPEDYVKGRKRDRIKKIARKLGIRPSSSAAHEGSSGSGSGSGSKGRGVFGNLQRASSVPASPVRRSSEVAPLEEDELPASGDPRRKSFDHAGDEARNAVREMLTETHPAPMTIDVDVAIVEDYEENAEGPHAGAEDGGIKTDDYVKSEVERSAVDDTEQEKEKEKEKEKASKDKDKDKDDAWGKLARRISVSMKLGTREKDSRPSSRAGERGRKMTPYDAVPPVSETASPRTTSLATATEPPVLELGEAAYGGWPQTSSPMPNPPRLAPILVPEKPPNSRRSSANPFKHRRRHGSPAKPSLRAKMSEGEMAYLARILADVHPVTGNPFSMLQHALTGGAAGSPGALAAQGLWAKLGHLPGVEECLRMFTAVEILDGENMVGCRRCWKINNGTYNPHIHEDGDIGPEDDSDSESEESDNSSKSDQSTSKASQPGQLPANPPGLSKAEDSSAVSSSPDLSSGQVSPASTSMVSSMVTTRTDDFAYVSSAPTTISSVPPTLDSLAYAQKDSAMPPEQPTTYGGLPIPQISTTEVDNSEDVITGPPLFNKVSSGTWSSTRAVVGLSLSDDSLLTPKTRRRKGVKKDDEEDSGSSSDDDYDDSASDMSAPTSVGSDVSMSPFVSPRSSAERLSDTLLPSASASPILSQDKPLPHRVHDKKISRAKQVIPRRMYKRYLISTPPPILVVHLKRFQQTTKHMVSLSGGIKKLDDFVSFPEYLNLAPFLAPKRTDFAPDKLEKGRNKQQERCMYRLYGVVVHIGNMLGGHYVAYTALPQSSPSPIPDTPSSNSEKPISPTPAVPASSSVDPRPADAQSPRQWAYISDAVVKLTTLEEVLKAKAYICMYERV